VVEAIAERSGLGETEGVLVRFYKTAIHKPRRSKDEGRPIFEEEDFVEIMVPGNALEVVNTKVTQDHMERFPTVWANYERNGGKETPLEGTPIAQWPLLSRTQVATMQALHVWTVENLIALDDQGLQKIGPGGRDLQRKAGAYLKTASEDAPAYQADDEIKKLETQVAHLNERIEGLQEALDFAASRISEALMQTNAKEMRAILQPPEE